MTEEAGGLQATGPQRLRHDGSGWGCRHAVSAGWGCSSLGSASQWFPHDSQQHQQLSRRLPGQPCTSLRTAASGTSEGGSLASPNSDGPSATPLNPLSDDGTPSDKVHSSALGGRELCLGTSILALSKVTAPYTCNSCMLKFFFFLYCSGFCHTLTWISHGSTCVPLLDLPSHLPPHPFPLGLPSAPALSTCLMHPTWAGDLFHPW